MENYNKSQDKEEWNRHFDYKTNKELKNERDWVQKYENINQDMNNKAANFVSHITKQD